MGKVNIKKINARVSLPVIRHLVKAIMQAEVVDYSPQAGVVCPICGSELTGKNMGIRRTCPWDRGARERYHTCPICALRFKSIEVSD